MTNRVHLDHDVFILCAVFTGLGTAYATGLLVLERTRVSGGLGASYYMGPYSSQRIHPLRIAHTIALKKVAAISFSNREDRLNWVGKFRHYEHTIDEPQYIPQTLDNSFLTQSRFMN